MDLMRNLKPLDDVLHALREGGILAIVAGGYLRDAWAGVQAKDVDVFILEEGGQPDAWLDLESRLRRALGVPVKTQFDFSYGEDSEVVRVFQTGMVVNGAEVQVIETGLGSFAELLERAHRHDFGAVQARYSLFEGLVFSLAFADDHQNRTFTLTHCESARAHARSMRRVERWLKRPEYAGWKLVDNTEWAVPALGEFL